MALLVPVRSAVLLMPTAMLLVFPRLGLGCTLRLRAIGGRLAACLGLRSAACSRATTATATAAPLCRIGVGVGGIACGRLRLRRLRLVLLVFHLCSCWWTKAARPGP